MDISCHAVPENPHCFSMFTQISRSILLRLIQNVLAEGKGLEGIEQLQLVEASIQADKRSRRYWTDHLGALAHSRKLNLPIQTQIFQALAIGLDLGHLEFMRIPDTFINSVYLPSTFERKRKGTFYEVSLNSSAAINIVDDDDYPIVMGDDRWNQHFSVNMESVVKDSTSYKSALIDHLEALKEISIPYYLSVNQGIGKILPIAVHPGSVTSSSYTNEFGTARIGMPQGTWETIEALVHESCHQYLNQVSYLIRPIADEELKLLSPFTNENRSVVSLFFGYHALGNVILLQQTQLNSCNQALLNRFEYLVSVVAKYEKLLIEHQALTPAGLEMIDPLRQKIRPILFPNSTAA